MFVGANVHATTATGDTALTYACENGHTDVADVLLQAGADLVRLLLHPVGKVLWALAPKGKACVHRKQSDELRSRDLYKALKRGMKETFIKACIFCLVYKIKVMGNLL